LCIRRRKRREERGAEHTQLTPLNISSENNQ
jgi:hypothetical protein